MHDSGIGTDSRITLFLPGIGFGIKKIKLCCNRNHAFKPWNQNQGFGNIGYRNQRILTGIGIRIRNLQKFTEMLESKSEP